MCWRTHLNTWLFYKFKQLTAQSVKLKDRLCSKEELPVWTRLIFGGGSVGGLWVGFKGIKVANEWKQRREIQRCTRQLLRDFATNPSSLLCQYALDPHYYGRDIPVHTSSRELLQRNRMTLYSEHVMEAMTTKRVKGGKHDHIYATVLQDAMEEWLALWDDISRQVENEEVDETIVKDDLLPWLTLTTADVVVQHGLWILKHRLMTTSTEKCGPIVWKFIESSSYKGMQKLAERWNVKPLSSEDSQMEKSQAHKDEAK